MLVFTKQFSAVQREKDGKKKNTPHLAMRLVLIIMRETEFKMFSALGILSEISALRISLRREELSRCQYYTRELA